MRGHVRWALSLLLAAGCGNPSTDAPVPSGPPTITPESELTSASSSAAASVKEPPAMAVRASFDAGTMFFPVEKSIIACTAHCMSGAASVGTAETFVVDRDGSKKAPLNPEGTWRSQYGTSVFKQANGISFYGTYPGGKLYARLAAPYDRSGYGSVSDLVSGPSGWQSSSGDRPAPASCALDHWHSPQRDMSGCSETRRKLLPKLEKAPFGIGRLIDLPNDAGFVPMRDSFARTTDMKQKPAPWQRSPHEVVPLTDGTILAAGETAVYRIKPDDTVEVVEVADGERTRKLEGVELPHVLVINEEPWLSFTQDGKAWLAMAADAKTKVFRNKPAARAERVPHEIPLPTKLEDSCTTPFAILSSNTAPDWVFGATMHNFMKDKSLAGEATFMSIVRDGANYFGVQLKTRAGLDKVKTIAAEHRQKPQLACLDALAKIPDLTNPPAGVEIYFVNYEQQQLLAP